MKIFNDNFYKNYYIYSDDSLMDNYHKVVIHAKTCESYNPVFFFLHPVFPFNCTFYNINIHLCVLK